MTEQEFYAEKIVVKQLADEAFCNFCESGGNKHDPLQTAYDKHIEILGPHSVDSDSPTCDLMYAAIQYGISVGLNHEKQNHIETITLEAATAIFTGVRFNRVQSPVNESLAIAYTAILPSGYKIQSISLETLCRGVYETAVSLSLVESNA